MSPPPKIISRRLLLGGLAASAAGIATLSWWKGRSSNEPTLKPSSDLKQLSYRQQKISDTSGYVAITTVIPPWKPTATLKEIGNSWQRVGYRNIEELERILAADQSIGEDSIKLMLLKAMFFNYEGEPQQADRTLEEMLAAIRSSDELSEEWLYSLIYYQGVSSLRLGENENCVHCRGASSCILPIVAAAVHTNPIGSRRAIEHFTEYLKQFPNDLEIQWLLNVAHMTLGEYPAKVDRKFFLSLDRYETSEFDIGKFRDVSAEAGVDRFSMSGGAIMDDFDNDGLLDLVVTTRDLTEPMSYYHNKGDGTFEDRTEKAGLGGQLGGFNCVQADYDNDGNLDIFVVRGAWLNSPIRPSLLKNNGQGIFTDVTEEAGLLDPVNSPCAVWADYDNDGFLDLFICCERQPNRLYHNQGNGKFKEVAAAAGLRWDGRCAKGATWIDYDNDGWPDLFICNSGGAPSQLFHNNGDGTFTEVSRAMGIHGPTVGFSCWAWDYDNDGWLDIFATSYDRTLEDVIKGLQGRPHNRPDTNKLYRNMGGKGFRDVTAEVGLDMVFASMGSNYGDFDNDGFLDFYLGTGDPDLAMLVPNRMFKNVAGKRFAEVTGSSGTGHLQKGHGVACGDLRQTGNIDVFIQMGGVANGDKYHNILFQNPGHANNWLTVKLVGKKTNRSAIGARIKVVTAGSDPLTVHRHVSSGSSFGGNPLEQTIGLGQANRIAILEIDWPTSRTKQIFHDIAANQAIEVTEFAKEYRKLDRKPSSKS